MARNVVEGKNSKGEKQYYHGIMPVGKSKKDLLPGDSFVREDGKKETIRNKRLMVPGYGGLIEAPAGAKESDCFVIIESIIEEV